MTTIAVGIRFPRGDWERHSAAAQARGLPLGTYLRQLIEEKEQGSTAHAELRALLEQLLAKTEEKGGPSLSRAVQIEMILLLRQLASPAACRIAWAEVKRQGLEPWHEGGHDAEPQGTDAPGRGPRSELLRGRG